MVLMENPDTSGILAVVLTSLVVLIRKHGLETDGNPSDIAPDAGDGHGGAGGAGTVKPSPAWRNKLLSMIPKLLDLTNDHDPALEIRVLTVKVIGSLVTEASFAPFTKRAVARHFVLHVW